MEHSRAEYSRELRAIDRYLNRALRGYEETYLASGPADVLFDVMNAFGLFVSSNRHTRSIISVVNVDLSYELYLQALRLNTDSLVKIKDCVRPRVTSRKQKYSPVAALALGKTIGTKEDVAIVICDPRIGPVDALCEIQSGIGLLFKEKLRMN